MEHLDENTVLGFLGATLPDDERRQVEGHMDRCAECRELISSLAEGLARTLPTDSAPASDGPWAAQWKAGNVIADRFEIEGHAGTGGMGTIFRARDRVSGEDVALKAMLDLQADERRFEREARVLSELVHPAIVRYVAHGSTRAGQAYLAMEWLEGEDLAERLVREPMSALDAVRLARRVAEGLAAAHGRGVVHRDVKPSNIFLCGGDVSAAKIIDFGIARSRRLGTGATRTGLVLGTPGYIAPEQARGAGAADERADVFSLGCVLYESLTGVRAFAGSDLLEVLAKVLLETPRPPGDLRRGVPAPLDKLVLAMLSKAPAKRPADCCTVATELGRIEALVASATEDGSRTRVETLGRWARSLSTTVRSLERQLPRSKPAIAVAGALALVMLGAGFLRARARSSIAPSPVASTAPAPAGLATALVLGIENRTSDAIFDGTLDEVLSSALYRSSMISAVSGARLRALASELDAEPQALDERIGQKLSSRDGGRVINIRGAVSPRGTGYSLSLTATDAKSGSPLLSIVRDAAVTDRVVPTLGQMACDLRTAAGDPPLTDPALAEQTGMSTSLEADHEYTLGAALNNSGKFVEGVAHLESAVAIDPQFTKAHGVLALVLENVGRQTEATHEFQLAIQSADSLGDNGRLKFVGDYDTHTGDYDGAVAAYEELLRRRPGDIGAEASLMNAYGSRGDADAAEQLSRKAATEHAKNVILRSNVIVYEFFVNNFAGAARDAEKVFDEFPQPPPYAYSYYAVAKTILGDRATAMDAFRKLSAIDASLATSGLADLAMSEGRLSDAGRLLDQGIQADLGQKHDDAAMAKWSLLAAVRLRGGDKAGALAAADSAAAAHETTTLYAVAETYIEAKQEKKALAIASRLGQRHAQNYPAMYAKLIEADARRTAGKARDALDALKEAQQIHDSWLGHYALARARLDLGEFSEAERELKLCGERRGEGAVVFDIKPTLRYLTLAKYYLALALRGSGNPEAETTLAAFLSLTAEAQGDTLVEEARRKAYR
jgi:tetratricopeptide (TPR) repeat protein